MVGPHFAGVLGISVPIKTLKNGVAVLLDAEDFDLFDVYSWHVYRIRPSMRPAVARSETRYQRVYRVMLHREIALRINPDLVKRKFLVYPANGDYLDCRRGNLEIVVRKKRGPKGLEPRPVGWQRAIYEGGGIGKRPLGEPSALWSGGLTVRSINRARYGEGQHYRLCVGGRPVPID